MRLIDGLGAINDLCDYLLAEKNNLDAVIGFIIYVVRCGEPVYLTSRAARRLRSVLEKHGIRLVPANRIEDKAWVMVRAIAGERDG